MPLQHDDLLHPVLTVYETLLYTARLRMPRAMSRQAKKDRVDAVIRKLGLDRCKNTIIGGGVAFGGFGRQRISGGEGKRTSIGVEILLKPSVLMLGEIYLHFPPLLPTAVELARTRTSSSLGAALSSLAVFCSGNSCLPGSHDSHLA